MEVAAKRTILLSAVLLAFGVAAILRPAIRPEWKTEAWVESSLPTELRGFSMERSPSDPSVSYKASDIEYKVLQPFGIVGRVFDGDQKRFDSLVVVGNNRDCFHDPNFCMAGQYFDISGEHAVSLDTKTRGTVPVTVMGVQDKDGKRLVAFTYLGPSGFHPTQNTLYSDWFWTELRLGKPNVGAFYRFMTMSEHESEDDLLAFARDYLDAAKQSSKGEL